MMNSVSQKYKSRDSVERSQLGNLSEGLQEGLKEDLWKGSQEEVGMGQHQCSQEDPRDVFGDIN